MINKINGFIELPEYNTILSPKIEAFMLQQSEFYKRLFINKQETGEGYIWYNFNHFSFQNYTIKISACFYKGLLHSIQFTTQEETDLHTWDNWSKEKEMQVFMKNNSFLDMIFQSTSVVIEHPFPSYQFAFIWGNVSSYYDPKSASSSMSINYV